MLQSCLEVRQRGGVAFGVLVDPAVVDQPDGDRIEVVQLLPADAADDDQPCGLEDPQMLHDAEARHLQLGFELRQRAAVALEEPVEEEPTCSIGQRLEDEVVIRHVPDNM